MSAAYDLLLLHSQANRPEPSKYFGLSMMLHAALAVAAFFVTAPLLEKIKEPITVEIISSAAEIPVPILKTIEVSKGEKVPESAGTIRQNSPAPSAPIESEIAKVIKAPAAKSIKSKSPIAKMKTTVSKGLAPVKMAQSVPSRAGVPETVEDIAAPELDFDGMVAAQPGKLGDDEFEKDFKNIDHSNAAAINAQKAELDNEAKMVSDEQDTAMKDIEDNNQAQAHAMDDALKATRTKNAAALASIKAFEQAAAEKAAKQEAELRKQTAAANATKGKAQAGNGQGATGDDKNGKVAGDPNGVRSLDQLRQIPGNPKPQYAMDERLRREQGLVAFHAFISKSGTPSDFRLTSSTGFRNLDGKTLAALKKWKFYPGQEGWVEIPFKWDLKGGVQELPTLLRRYGSK